MTAMTNVRRVLPVLAACITVTVTTALLAQKSDKDQKDPEARRPKIMLRVQPAIAIAPARIVLTAELQGGDNNFEEYYCPSIEWEWGDDTSSESSIDCEPYQSATSQIKRRFTVEHLFRRPGQYKVYFHLKRKAKTVASASATLQVQPGGRDFSP
jgi:hypothetical protein